MLSVLLYVVVVVVCYFTCCCCCCVWRFKLLLEITREGLFCWCISGLFTPMAMPGGSLLRLTELGFLQCLFWPASTWRRKSVLGNVRIGEAVNDEVVVGVEDVVVVISVVVEVGGKNSSLLSSGSPPLSSFTCIKSTGLTGGADSWPSPGKLILVLVVSTNTLVKRGFSGGTMSSSSRLWRLPSASIMSLMEDSWGLFGGMLAGGGGKGCCKTDVVVTESSEEPWALRLLWRRISCIINKQKTYTHMFVRRMRGNVKEGR